MTRRFFRFAFVARPRHRRALIAASAIAIAAMLASAATVIAEEGAKTPPGTPPGASDSLRSEIESVVREYIQRNPNDIREIVRDYLANNPEFLQQILADAIRKQRPPAATAERAAPAPTKSAAVKENADKIFNSPHQVTLGNPNGDVTLVEFFDYSCGFCKRALADKLELLKTDPKLRLVLKEFPILGPGSVEAARYAVALRMQDAKGERYLAFHKQLLGDRAPPSRDRALEAARAAGADMDRLEKDATSDEVRATIEESVALARSLGINGTPSYVVGESVVVGAVGLATLRGRIEAARR